MSAIPIIRFEVEGMRHTLCIALSEHAAQLDADMQQAVADFCKPENIKRVVNEVADRTMKAAIQEEVNNFFRYGEGRKVVAAAVKERLLTQNTYTPIDEVKP